MSFDPWAKQQPNEPRIYFAQSKVTREVKISSNGNEYAKMDIQLVPIEPGEAIKEVSYYNFQAPWQHITVPSVMKLVASGKLQAPLDLEKDQFVSYRWSTYKSYAKKDIDYWQEQNPNKLEEDEHGRIYKPSPGIEFLDVFPDQETWEQAYNSVASEQPSPEYENAVKILSTIVGSCGTDMTRLSQVIGNATNLNQFFTVESDEVRREVAKLVAFKAGHDVESQEELLAEINSHFENGSYLDLGSPELVEVLAEMDAGTEQEKIDF